MNSVRGYREKDKENVRRICVESAGCKDADEEIRQYLTLLYCDYYIEHEPENCFVAVDEQDNAVGYIICSGNYYEFERIFSEEYLPKIAALGAKRYVDAKLDLLSHGMFKDMYPAHLHINIDENYRRIGLGSYMLSVLKAHLKKKGISNVMLVCDNDNYSAIAFYEKNGFKKLLSTKMGVAMVQEFEDNI